MKVQRRRFHATFVMQEILDWIDDMDQGVFGKEFDERQRKDYKFWTEVLDITQECVEDKDVQNAKVSEIDEKITIFL